MYKSDKPKLRKNAGFNQPKTTLKTFKRGLRNAMRAQVTGKYHGPTIGMHGGSGKKEFNQWTVSENLVKEESTASDQTQRIEEQQVLENQRQLMEQLIMEELMEAEKIERGDEKWIEGHVSLNSNNVERQMKDSGQIGESIQPTNIKVLIGKSSLNKKIITKSQRLNYLVRLKLGWANQQHEYTLGVLKKELITLSYLPEENEFIDCFTSLKSGPAIFEVKSISEENELDQVRAAISQLYEYRFRHNYPTASLWIVLSRHLKIEWLLNYLIQDRGINVLWIHNGILTGPSLTFLD